MRRPGLEQTRPPPFNPTTVIRYHLSEASDDTLTFFDAPGRKVRVLDSGHKSAGTYSDVLESAGLTSGVYLYRPETPTFSDTKRMILSRQAIAAREGSCRTCARVRISGPVRVLQATP
jgi:hypothetical protein